VDYADSLTSRYCVSGHVAAVSGTTNGLTGTYYNNRWLQAPVAMTRVDAFIDLNWGTSIITPTAKDYVR